MRKSKAPNDQTPAPTSPVELTLGVVQSVSPRGMTATVTLGGDVFGRGRRSRAADLPFGGRLIPDYVAILQGLALNMGNPPSIDLDVTIPKTEVVDLGNRVGDFWVNSLIVVALRRGHPDVDLANPDTYTLVKVSSDSSSVTARLCEESTSHVNRSLFCSLVAANTPRSSDAKSISVHMGMTAEMRAQTWRAENPGYPEYVDLRFKDQDNSYVHFKVTFTCPMSKIFDAFCSRKALNRDSVRFLFDGTRINPAMTPADLEMKAGDVIDCMMEQVGMHVRCNGRDGNEALTGNVNVTVCVPGETHVTVSIKEQQTLKEATTMAALQVPTTSTMAALQMQLELAQTQAAEAHTTIAVIKTRMKEVEGASARKRTRADFA